MSSSAARIPNFSGVALVDILANGVAVLIIVIVLSIAARAEKEERYSEKVQEVSAVMTREFSTSLVLNRLAASPPAQLHDYETSELDQIWDPVIMPVIEFHSSFVRDPYSGAIWNRNELLQSPNGLDSFLMDLGEYSRTHVRGDIYDVGTYYLVMSILRDHNIRIWHWHFIGGVGGADTAGSAADCPPGVSYEDCLQLGADGRANYAAQQDNLGVLGGFARDDDDQTEGTPGSSWPPSDDSTQQQTDDQLNDQVPGTAVVPEGSSLGRGGNPSLPDGALESFPDARPPSNSSGSSPNFGPGDGSSGNEQGNSFTIRLADPSAQDRVIEGISMEMPEPQQVLAALMLYLNAIQEMLNNDRPPTELLENFTDQLSLNLQVLDALPIEERTIVDDLYASMQLRLQSPNAAGWEPLVITTEIEENLEYGILNILPNRVLLDAVAVTDPTNSDLDDVASPRLLINMFPDVWQGLQVTLTQGSVLLMSPKNPAAEEPAWYAVAYLSSTLDDMIVGFLYGRLDEEGYFSIYSDSNRVRLDSQEITPSPITAFFGAKAWLMTMYIVFGLLLFLFFLFWRPGLKNT